MASQLALLFAAPPAGARRADRPRPGRASTRASPACTARSTRCARKKRVIGRRGQPAQGAWSPARRRQEAFADADLVIEAVFEELAVKKQVFAEVEAVVRPRLRARDEHVVAVRDARWRPTSSTPSGSSASTSSTRSRCCRCSRSCAASAPTTPTLATAFAVGKQLKKSCVLVKDAPAFVVNRLLTRFLGEVTRAVDEGTPIEVADRALDAARAADAARSCCCSWSARLSACTWPRRCTRPSPSASTSRTTCAGWSRPASPASTPGTSAGALPRRRTPALLPAGRHRRSTAEEVRDRALAALAEEIAPDARRGRGRRAAGHRPVPDPRRRLAVPPRRHHARTSTGPARPSA